MLGSLLALAIVHSSQNSLPSEPIKLSGATDLTGREVTIEPQDSFLTVFFVISHDCPIANRYAPEIGRITDDYRDKKIKFYRVYIGETDLTPKLIQHGKDFELTMPGLIDFKMALSKKLGVRVTPEVAVVDQTGKLQYRGRIDDQNVEHGKIRSSYRKDLRIALDELLDGKKVSIPATAAIGCYIPFESN